MIYKIICDDKTEWAQAKNQLHLLQSYDDDYDGFHEITDVLEISDEEAKLVMLRNVDYNEDDPDDVKEISLFDSVIGDDFVIVGSTEWD